MSTLRQEARSVSVNSFLAHSALLAPSGKSGLFVFCKDTSRHHQASSQFEVAIFVQKTDCYNRPQSSIPTTEGTHLPQVSELRQEMVRSGNFVPGSPPPGCCHACLLGAEQAHNMKLSGTVMQHLLDSCMQAVSHTFWQAEAEGTLDRGFPIA